MEAGNEATYEAEPTPNSFIVGVQSASVGSACSTALTDFSPPAGTAAARTRIDRAGV